MGSVVQLSAYRPPPQPAAAAMPPAPRAVLAAGPVEAEIVILPVIRIVREPPPVEAAQG